jgi:hypothetical protein
VRLAPSRITSRVIRSVRARPEIVATTVQTIRCSDWSTGTTPPPIRAKNEPTEPIRTA